MKQIRTYRGQRMYYKDNVSKGSQINHLDGKVFGLCDYLVIVDNEILPSSNFDNNALGKRFLWGNRTSLAFNLAESILVDYIQHLSNNFDKPVDLPKELVIAFLNEIIAPLNSDMWQLSEFQIADFINTYLANDAEGYDDEIDEVDEEAITLMEAFVESIEK